MRRIARIREKIRDLIKVKCIKVGGQKVLVKDMIKDRYRRYFSKLLNENHINNLRYLISSIEDRNIRYTYRIKIYEVKEVKKIKIGRRVGSNKIHIKVWNI